MPTIGTSPDSLPSSSQVRVDSAPMARAAPSGIGGPEPPPARPPPPSEYSTTGSLYRWATPEHAVGLLVVLGALGAGQHRVVVGHHGAPGVLRADQLAVDLADADHHAVGGGAQHPLFQGVPVSERSRAAVTVGPYSAKRAGIAQVGDVLADGAPALGVPLARGRRTALVGGQEVQALDFGQVRADLVGVRRCRVHVFAVRLPRLDEQDRGALEDRCRRPPGRSHARRRRPRCGPRAPS